MQHHNPSDGIGSVISGGDPLQGAAQGLVVYFANHLAHELTPEQSRARLKAKIEKDGILTLKEANKWYRRGDGSPITVDANKIDVSNIDAHLFYVGKGVEINLLTSGNVNDGLVYGKLNMTLDNNNFVTIETNKYDFDLPSNNWKNVKGFIRNVETIGGYVNSLLQTRAYSSYGIPIPAGFPFDVIFKGNIPFTKFNWCIKTCN